MYIVYTEIFENGIERWYYGTYSNRDVANYIAMDLGNEYPMFHCVCKEEDAEDFGIKNLP